jgi:hypothetical protein
VRAETSTAALAPTAPLQPYARRATVGALALSLAACGPPVPPTYATPYRIWSDEAVLSYARSPWDQDRVRSAVLGVHRGARLLQDVKCSDVCPDHTVRIIRYDLHPRLSCDQVHGKAKAVTVPVGVGLESVEFCFPSVLVDHWDEIRPMLGPFVDD